MLDIPPPPMLQTEPAWAWLIAVCASAGGITLLLWGRQIHRALLVMVAAGAALALAAPLTGGLSIPPLVSSIVLVVIAVTAAILAARVVWAVLGASLLASSAVVVLAYLYDDLLLDPHRAYFIRFDDTFTAWATAWPEYVLDAAVALWHAVPIVAAVAGAVAIVPLVLLMLRPRLGAIFMTALLGASALMGGLLLAAAMVRPAMWEAAWTNHYITLSAVAVLLVFGVIYQYRSAVIEERARKEREKAKEAEKKKAEAAKAATGKEKAKK